MPGPLAGLKVVELAQGWAGPFAAMELGDMGADVLKVEPPQGDFTRQLGPPFPQGEAIPFLAINRSKRAIVLDLRQDRAKEVLFGLVQAADIVIESYRPGEADALGIGYDRLKETNPRLIYATITPFGQEGPYRDRAGSELTTQMMAGWTSYFGEPEGAPVIMGGEQAGIFAAKYLTIGILAALARRARSGQGQRVDTSLLGGLVGQPMSYVMDDIQYSEEEWKPLPVSGPQRGLATKDMAVEFNFYISGYIPNDEAWIGFFGDIGAAHLAGDDRFTSNAGRMANKAALDVELEKAMASFSANEILELCLKRGAMASPFHTLEAMATHPQTVANEMIVTVQHDTLGELRMIGTPSWFHSSPSEIVLAPPTLGQHTIEILTEAGYSEQEIEELLLQGEAL